MDWRKRWKRSYRIIAFVMALLFAWSVSSPITIINAEQESDDSGDDKVSKDEADNEDGADDEDDEVDEEAEEENKTPWGKIQSEINKASKSDSEVTIKLTENIKAGADEESLVVSNGQNVKIDLDGHTISRGLAATNKVDDGYVIKIESGGTLILTDTSKEPGLITGGANIGKGGGIFLEDKAELTVTGGVKIKKNVAKQGGGIYLSEDCELYLGDCTIWGNDVTNGGGGIYGGKSHISFLGGLTKIENNTKGGSEDNDLFIPAEMEELRFWTWSSKNEKTRKAKYTDEFKKGSRIGVILEEMRKEISDGYGQCNPLEASVFFFYDNDDYLVSRDKQASEITIIKDQDKVNGNTKTVVEIYKNNKLKSTETFNSFMEAYNVAQGSSDDAVIIMGGDYTSDSEIVLGSNKSVTIDLNGHYIKRDRGYEYKKNGGVICVETGATLTIEDSNPKKKGYDGIKGGVITGGASSNYGGGITVKEKGHLIMKGGTIYDCITDEDGGGVYLDTGSNETSFKMRGGRIYNCRSLDSTDNCNGGAIYLGAGMLDLKNGTIDNCYSEDAAGAIYCNRGQVSLDNMVFSGNRATNRGGAIYISLDLANYEGTLFYASNCSFVNNKSDEDGGAFFMRDNPSNGGAVMFDRCVFRDNIAKEDGGAIVAFDDGLVLSNVKITGNKAGGYGGGVYVDSRYDLNLKGIVVIKDNTCDGDSTCRDVALEEGTSTTARVNSGGIVRGSWIGIGSTGSKSIRLSKKISLYEMRYFHSHGGSIGSKSVKSIDVDMVYTTSIFGTGSKMTMIVLSGFAIVAAVAAGVYARRKKTLQTKKGDEL